jgi:E3 ubiquitin-protein ligase RNF13
VDRIAAFGPRIDGDIGITGHLLKISDGEQDGTFGCLPVTSPPNVKDWIALVERGQCSFLQKVKTMQDSGAIAVIVGDKHFNGWVTMYAPGKKKRKVYIKKATTKTYQTGDTSDVHIPSVFVAQHQYKALLQLFDNNNNQSIPVKLSGDDLLTWYVYMHKLGK